MELKLGYKQTEVGVIPEDWEVKLLPDLCRFRGGKAHEQYISESGQFVCVNSKFISSDGKSRKYSTANFCYAKRDDILMVMSDLPNGRALAKAYLVEIGDLYAVNQRVCALTPYRDFPQYLYYILNRNPYFLKFDDGVNQTHLLNHVFKNCPVPVPPTIGEQRAIAEALGDVDALLDALIQLIAKKRDLKQAAMQQLLTGQHRLPGFHGEWKVDTFGNRYVEPSRNGISKPAPFQGRGTRIVNMREMFGFDFISNQEMGRLWLTPKEIAAYSLRNGDLLFGRRSVVPEGAGKCTLVVQPSEPLVFESSIIRVRLNPIEANPLFYHYYFASPSGRAVMSVIVSGTNVKGIRASELRELRVPQPELPEQTAIAEVLSDMDSELAALEARREKIRALKQGMMQELLTGRTRLV